MKLRLRPDESLLLIPAVLLLFLGPALTFVLPLTPRDRLAVLGVAVLGIGYVAYLIYRTLKAGLRRQYPFAPLAGLALNLAGVYVLHRFFPAIDLVLFITVVSSGALWGLRTGLGMAGLAAAGYTAVLFVLMPISSLSLISLLVFDLNLLFVGGITGLLATQEQKRRAQLEATSAAELRQAQLLKEELYEMIMHDLKSPLGTMISALHILHDTLPPEAQTAQAALDAALKAGERQTTLLENLLDLQRLRAGALPLNLDQLDLGPILHSLVEQLAVRADQKAIQIEERFAPALPAVRADRQLITRVAANLLDNAYKFTPANGRITVTAEAGPDSLRVIVADTGPGVPAAERQAIFEKYRQIITGEVGARDGAGLGLAFCKMALQAHGGQISVGGAPGTGAQFEFTLPLAPLK